MAETSPQVMVLGPHRSGTSALGGMLPHIGISAGDPSRLMKPSKVNAKGFYERVDVVHLNTKLMQAVGLDWIAADLFDPRRLPEEAIPGFRDDANRIIGDMGSRNEPWFIKDPRLCLTLPFWTPLLENPFALIVLREPMEVAESLRNRGDCSVMTGLAIWEVYSIALIRTSASMPRYTVLQQDLIQDPVGVIHGIRNWFEEKGCMLPHPCEGEVSGWIDRKLVHDRQARDDALVSAHQRNVYEAIADGQAWVNPGSWKISDQAAGIVRDHLAYSTHTRAAMLKLHDQYEKLLPVLNQYDHAENELDRIIGEMKQQREMAREALTIANTAGFAKVLSHFKSYTRLLDALHRVLDGQNHSLDAVRRVNKSVD